MGTCSVGVWQTAPVSARLRAPFTRLGTRAFPVPCRTKHGGSARPPAHPRQGQRCRQRRGQLSGGQKLEAAGQWCGAVLQEGTFAGGKGAPARKPPPAPRPDLDSNKSLNMSPLVPALWRPIPANYNYSDRSSSSPSSKASSPPEPPSPLSPSSSSSSTSDSPSLHKYNHRTRCQVHVSCAALRDSL